MNSTEKFHEGKSKLTGYVSNFKELCKKDERDFEEEMEEIFCDVKQE